MYDLVAHTINSEVYVRRGAKINLLDISELIQLNMLALVNTMCSNEFDYVKKFSKVFAGLGTMPGVFTIDIKANVQSVGLYGPRQIAAGLRQKAKEELDKVLKNGVIEPIEQATDWCSGLTIAPRSNGKIGMW